MGLRNILDAIVPSVERRGHLASTSEPVTSSRFASRIIPLLQQPRLGEEKFISSFHEVPEGEPSPLSTPYASNSFGTVLHLLGARESERPYLAAGESLTAFLKTTAQTVDAVSDIVLVEYQQRRAGQARQWWHAGVVLQGREGSRSVFHQPYTGTPFELVSFDDFIRPCIRYGEAALFHYQLTRAPLAGPVDSSAPHRHRTL